VCQFLLQKVKGYILRAWVRITVAWWTGVYSKADSRILFRHWANNIACLVTDNNIKGSTGAGDWQSPVVSVTCVT